MPMSGRSCQHRAVTHATGRPTSADPSSVATRDDFGDFLQAVLADYHASGKVEWENATLDRFLEALSAFSLARIADDDGQESASWRLIAEMVAAATGYE